MIAFVVSSAQTIRRWLDRERPRLVELLELLVVTESHAAHPAGVAAVAETLAAELAPVGFSLEATPQSPVPASLHWLEGIFSPGIPYTDLGATYSGVAAGTGGRLLLLGDLDTAFPVGALADAPFRIESGRAYGPGIADMKGGLVVLVAALQALHALGIERPEIALVLAGDEQAGSLGSRPIIEAAARNADWCLCVECARRGGKLMAARGHIGVGSLRITGAEAHTGSARDKGVNALEALARLVLAFNALSDPGAGTLVTVTIARAGRRRSIVPASAEAVVDIRTRAIEDWERTTTRMRELVAHVAADSRAEIELLMHSHRPGVVWDEQTDRMLALTRQIGSELDMDIEAFASAAAGSSSFRQPTVTTLDGLGPVGAGLMTADEHIEIDSIVPRAALLAELIHRLPRLTDREDHR
jgi:glutamate carboxypeptidase